MIKTTFQAYTSRFKEFMTILKPLIVVQILTLIVGVLTGIYDKDFGNPLLFLAGVIVTIILAVLQWLIYAPAAFRTVQKRELGESITVEQAIAFQKTDKWNYFMFMIWSAIYGFAYTILIFAPIAIGVLTGFFVSQFGTIGLIGGMILGVLGCLVGVRMAYIHYPKIFFAMNIYLAKSLPARDNVRESIALGIAHRNTIWKFMVGLIVVNIFGAILNLVPILFNFDVVRAGVEPSFTYTMLASAWSLAVGLLFVIPVTYLYLSKAYAKMRTITEPAIPHVPEGTVIPEVVQ